MIQSPNEPMSELASQSVKRGSVQTNILATTPSIVVSVPMTNDPLYYLLTFYDVRTHLNR